MHLRMRGAFAFVEGAMIIDFQERHMQVKPKTETRYHKGHYFVLEYDPNAPDGQRWVWRSVVTKRYEFYGSHATIESAARAAKRRIDRTLRIGGDT